MTIIGLSMEKGFYNHAYGTPRIRPMMLLVLLCLSGVTISRAAPLVIDHDDVLLYQHIPSATLTEVKKMWLNVPGESHSLGYRLGLSLLAQQDANFPVVVTESGSPEAYREDALRISRALRSGSSWVYGTGEDTWYTNSTGRQVITDHLDYCYDKGLEIAALGFGWSWDMTANNTPGGTEDPVYHVRWAGASVGGPEGDLRWGLDSGDTALTGNSITMDTYLDATETFDQYCSTNGYGTRVFFTTGPVDGYTGESGYQRYLKHAYIRSHVLASSDGVLFDYADILTYNDANEQNTTTWDGNEYPVIHADNMKDLDGTYTEDGDQIGEKGALRLGKAQWVLLARLAGWDGTSSTNQAPVMDALQDQTVSEGSPLSLTLGVTDPDGHALSVWASDLPTGATFTNQTLSWTPTYTQAGTYSVTFTASDGLLQDSETVTITVQQANRAPVLSSIGDKQVQAGSTLSFSISATDADGDDVTYSAYGLPTGATFTGQTFSWTPDNSDVGSYGILFLASDGSLGDSETITVTVTELDTTPPSVTESLPQGGDIQILRNTLIEVTIVDTGDGIDPSTVSMVVNGHTVYIGDTASKETAYGVCRRVAVFFGYRYVYQPTASFDYEEQVTVIVNASDQAGNPMDAYAFSFYTEMRSFGQNIALSSASLPSGRAAVADDSQGRTWIVWHAGLEGARDIYCTLRTGDTFAAGTSVTSGAGDQCFPVIAIGSDDTAYVVWQDNRRGQWDIYLSMSTDGSTWSSPVLVIDSNDNQTDPSVVVDSADNVTVAWVDDRAVHQDIYLASSNTLFVGTALHRITSNSADQNEPSLALAADGQIYVVWKDRRNGNGDIYGTTSATGWPIVPVVTGSSEQSEPALAMAPSGSVMYLLWVDDVSGNKDILYGSSTGLPSTPITGATIIDDTTDADQVSPRIVVGSDHESTTRIFASWTDYRAVAQTGDTDIYFAERYADGWGTNVLIEDDGYNADQTHPTLAMDAYGQPYIAWTDGRASWDRIYYAGGTYLNPTSLASTEVTVLGTLVGTDPNAIDGLEDVSILIPAGAIDYTVQVTISKIQNIPTFYYVSTLGYIYIAGAEIGPSGITFSEPATVTIPVQASLLMSDPRVFWYNAQTDALSQTGISDVTQWIVSSDIVAVQFKTTHCTPFYILNDPPLAPWLEDGAWDGLGSGGCALTPCAQTSVGDMLLPYGILFVLLGCIKRYDRRHRQR